MAIDAVTVVAALQTVDVDLDLSPAEGLFGGAVGTFVTTLVVGAVLLAVAPDYLEDRMAAVLDDPVGSFVYGIAVLLALALVVVVLALTIIGIVVVVPLVMLAYLVWALGATVAFLALADRLVGREDGWTTPLLVAAALNGGLVLSGVGSLVGLAVGAAGFGAVLEDRL